MHAFPSQEPAVLDAAPRSADREPVRPTTPVPVRPSGPRRTVLPAPDDPAALIAERVRPHLDLIEINACQSARGLWSGNVTLDDLRSFARDGLLRAARTYEPLAGVPLRRWANRCIQLAIAEGLRQSASVPRSRSREALEERRASEPGTNARERYQRREQARLHRFDWMKPSEPAPSPEEEAQRRELAEQLHAAIAHLAPDEQTLVLRHDLQEETLDAIARDLRMSRSWACRIHKRALAKLRRLLRRSDGLSSEV